MTHWSNLSAGEGRQAAQRAGEAAIDLLSACRIVSLRKLTGCLDLLTEARFDEKFRPNARDLVSTYGAITLPNSCPD